MKKIGIFGCKSTTIFLLEYLKEVIAIECVISITPEAGKANQVADYYNVAQYCERHNISYYLAKRYDLKSEEDLTFFSRLDLDLAFVIGWQRLLPPDVLDTFSIGAFGMHGSTDDLPVGRGRSPMNWGLIEQRKHFFTNIFRYNSGIDAGDILDTFVFSIQPCDTSETMHYKNAIAMKTLITKNLKMLLKGNFDLKSQKDIAPTYYPKRSPEDSLIDWRKDIFQIESFIRAVTKPFNGAFSYVKGKKVTIWRASIFETDIVSFGYRHSDWGTIVEMFPNGKFLVQCRGGTLIVHEFVGENIIEKGEILKSPIEKIKDFELNRYGYHDL